MSAARIYLVVTEAMQPTVGETYIPNPGGPIWRPVDTLQRGAQDWQEIKVTVNRRLSDDEVERVAGCLHYALCEIFAVAEISEPYVLRSYRAQQSILMFAADGAHSRRTEPDPEALFEVARGYIQKGTPVRTTNRGGAGTRGTRCVDGVGHVTVEFAVR